MCKLPFILFPLLLLPLCLFPQEEKQKIDDTRRELVQVRGEMQRLQNQLDRSASNLESQLSTLKNLEQQATLQKSALRLLARQIHENENLLLSLTSQIDELQGKLADLKAAFKEQILFAYKFQRGSQLEWLLGADSFNQALLRYRYFQTISGNAHRYYRRIAQEEARLLQLQVQQQRELEEKTRLANERAAEQRALESKRDQLRQLVGQIVQSQKLLTQSLNEKKRSYLELSGLLESLEKKRTGGEATPEELAQWDQIKGNFADQRRKLNWPAQGKILHPFGNYKNPSLKTVLVNNGIDIKAEKGTTVRCVFEGVVSLITYMSGFGNTLIVDHNNGYYTVYAHLDEILVKKFDFVAAGSILGTVGESGSLEGALLHFEIYGENRPLDPRQWLKNR